MCWPGVLVLWLFQRKHQLLFTNRPRSTYIMVTRLCFCKDQSYRIEMHHLTLFVGHPLCQEMPLFTPRCFRICTLHVFCLRAFFSLMNVVHGSLQSGRKWLAEHWLEFLSTMHCIATANKSRFNWRMELLIRSDQIVWLLWCQLCSSYNL